MKYKKQKGKVFLGMSGGVDSSVSAALLKQAGYEVVGVFIRAWSGSAKNRDEEAADCGWRAERREAMRVAAQLDLPLLTLDLTETYRREVVDYLLREYQAGRTPNPDVMCNRSVKFGGFYEWARARGADFIATGHYAQVRSGPGGPELVRSRDENKDQTYFLWTLTQEQLAHVLFPIGHLTKPEVRALAAKLKLPTAAKKDSQGVCFIGELDMKGFLKHELPVKAGVVENERGEAIGEHEGAILYTLGERHGFAVREQLPRQNPLYVVSRDLGRNVLVVSSAPETVWRRGRQVTLREINLIEAAELPDGPLLARVRHRGELVSCAAAVRGAEMLVSFDEPPSAMAPGQSLVLYQGEICLGGGVIAKVG